MTLFLIGKTASLTKSRRSLMIRTVMKKNLAAAALGRLGGKAILEKYGKDHFIAMGQAGGKPRKDGTPRGGPRVCSCGKQASVVHARGWVCVRCKAALLKKS